MTSFALLSRAKDILDHTGATGTGSDKASNNRVYCASEIVLGRMIATKRQ